jgi:hypothetical protein
LACEGMGSRSNFLELIPFFRLEPLSKMAGIPCHLTGIKVAPQSAKSHIERFS